MGLMLYEVTRTCHFTAEMLVARTERIRNVEVLYQLSYMHW